MAAQYKFLLLTQECLFKECVREDVDLQPAGMLRTAYSVWEVVDKKNTLLDLMFNYNRKPSFA